MRLYTIFTTVKGVIYISKVPRKIINCFYTKCPPSISLITDTIFLTEENIQVLETISDDNNSCYETFYSIDVLPYNICKGPNQNLSEILHKCISFVTPSRS